MLIGDSVQNTYRSYFKPVNAYHVLLLQSSQDLTFDTSDGLTFLDSLKKEAESLLTEESNSLLAPDHDGIIPLEIAPVVSHCCL